MQRKLHDSSARVQYTVYARSARTLHELVGGRGLPLGRAGISHAERERCVHRVLDRLEEELEAHARRTSGLLNTHTQSAASFCERRMNIQYVYSMCVQYVCGVRVLAL